MNRKTADEELLDQELTDLVQRAGDEDAGEGGAPEWMATFSDLMTLLMVFFILLFSMSEIQVKKFALAANSLKEGFGDAIVDRMMEADSSGAPRDSLTQPSVSALVDQIENAVISQRMETIQDSLEEFVSQNNLEKTVQVIRDGTGVTLVLRDVVLFSSGRAEVQKQSRWILEKLEPLLENVGSAFTVVGHTDDIPIRSEKFGSNWELSAARAGGVAHALIDLGISPQRIHVEAWGDQHPLVSNDSPQGRAMNRRVEIFFSRLDIKRQMASEVADSTSE